MDVRNERTCLAIKDALAELLKEKCLEDVSVSELARAAGISRSTLYCHFPNSSDVYDQLVADFLGEVSSMETQLRCQACQEVPQGKMPYCVAVRSTEKYRGVVRQRQYLPTMLRLYREMGAMEGAMAPYLKLGVDASAAWDLLSFQMTGCHMVATFAGESGPWEKRKQLLDTFIAGGMSAVRQAQKGAARRSQR